MAQTIVQNSNAIRFGSGKLEVGMSEATLVDIGAIKNAVFYDEFEKVEVKADNAGIVKIGAKDQAGYIECDMMETDFSKLSTFRGIDTSTAIEASPIAVTGEEHVLTGTAAVRLDHKEGDGTEVASIVVEDASGNACVRNTDYVITVDSAGYTCIARVSDSTKLTDGDTAVIDYSYTPNSAVKITSGGKHELSDMVVRITNTNENNKKLQITLHKASVEEGIKYEFPEDDSMEVAMVHLKLKGIRDISRTRGDQIWEIVDEQGVSA